MPREILRRLPSDRTISWSPDGDYIYFAQAEISGGFNVYQDLYRHNIKDEGTERLTYGLRVREPDVSPDGKAVVAVINDRGNQNIVILKIADLEADLEDEEVREKVWGGQLTDYKLARVSSPRWSPDGEKIVYTLKVNGGKSSLNLIDLKSKKVQALIRSDYNFSSAAWTSDGSHIIYSSDETGVYNLHAYSLASGKSYQVTNVVGGAFDPEVSPGTDRMFFSSYHSRGKEIAALDYNPEKWRLSSGPSVNPYWKESGGEKKRKKDKDPEAGVSGRINNPETVERKGYSVAGTILPRFWLPAIASDHDGAVVGALTAGQDALGYNKYIVEADRGTRSNENYYSLIYANDYYYPTFMVQSYSLPLIYTDVFQDYDFFERETSLSLSAIVPINRIESGTSLTLGYEWQDKESFVPLLNGQYPGVDIFEGKSNNAFAGIAYSSERKYPYSISREEGWSSSVLYKEYSPSLGSDFTMKKWLIDYSAYIPFPLTSRKRHDVISFRMRGGALSGDDIYQEKFHLGGAPGASEFPLRGYPSRFIFGNNIATATLEYRMPVYYILRGWNTKPFFWDRLHLGTFVDVGTVWNNKDDYSDDNVRAGIGVEIRFDITLGYMLKITPALGIAQGMGHDGEGQAYFTR